MKTRMGMNWRRRSLVQGALFTIGFATLIHFTSSVHFFIAAAVLLFAWPVTDVICESIASKNPAATKRIAVTNWWILAIQLGVILTITTMLWRLTALPFMTAFAYSFLGLSSVGAINGIIMELEDNAPGGWLNPVRRK